MDEAHGLAERFERHRAHLRDVAYRMLGSAPEAEDAVQEAWLRLTRGERADVENLGGWLTTVVARICLDMLRARHARREEPLDAASPEPPGGGEAALDPEREAALADAIGPALLRVLDTLAPAERLAFVLHDMFAVPFEEIAPIVGRSPVAARQLASRARRRVQGAPPDEEADRGRAREVVAAFLSASREGDLERLVALLDPEVVLRADRAAVEGARARRAAGAPPLASEVRGAPAVAKTFAGRARDARVALVDGTVGAAWVLGGKPRAAFAFTISDGKIVEIEVLADRDRVRTLRVTLLED